MGFPEHIARVLEAYGIRTDTKAALYELYLTLGDEVLDVFADYSDRVSAPSLLQPDDTLSIRREVVERYVRRNHPRWLEGTPTPSLWHPRVAEGRASGAAVPLGPVGQSLLTILPPDQPTPDGVLVLGRNAHLSGRQETVSFDVVARELDDALAIAMAEGQQHTLPGSVGQTTGSFDGTRSVALLWEIQPNVFKPAGERNRAIAKVYRRHRNWHLVTLAAALDWLGQQKCATYILRGDALQATHEMNPAKPMSESIGVNHDRTVQAVAATRGLLLVEPTDQDEVELLDSIVMNHALRQHVLRMGAAAAMWRVIDRDPRLSVR
ncbi:MAG TPA: hypothetical protein VF618_10585 [Thermoanaerobaculia bacterium]